MSCLTFLLSKLVPADEVDILLSVQGVDDSNDLYTKEYDALHKKMRLNLPYFYFSVKPSYMQIASQESRDVLEKKLITKLSKQKYNASFINELLDLIQQCPSKLKRQLLSSNNLDQIDSKLSSSESQLSETLVNSLQTHLSNGSNFKTTWHFPIITYNGFENQYHIWIKKIMQGDFGISLLDTRPVTDKLWEALKWSIVLIILNIFFSLILAFPIGVYNGVNPNSTFDTISNGLLFAFFAIPKFWLATLFIIFFTTSEYGAWTNIFPSVGGWYSEADQSFMSMLSDSWQKLILPVLILVIPDTAYLARLIRAGVQEEHQKEYIKTAKSKGLSKKEITVRHILPNSLIPTITLLVGVLPTAIASTLVIEVIFNIPGIGRLMYESIGVADWAMVYPIVLIISVLAVVFFLLGDIVIAFLNPKIKFK